MVEAAVFEGGDGDGALPNRSGIREDAGIEWA
jgi:hypothetical protein